MDRFHSNICNVLYNHLKNGLNPPIITENDDNELKLNIEKLVLNSNLHCFDDGDTIWDKLTKNKYKYIYFNNIDFLQTKE
jgi:hypothetical protein